MLPYSVKYQKNSENLDSTIFKARNGRLLMQSKCPVCVIKKSRFVKKKKQKVY